MEYLNLCINCMRLKRSPEQVCPHCGFDPKTYILKTHELPPFSILNGKYIVGKSLGAGGFGITYIAYDKDLEYPQAIKEFFMSSNMYRDSSSSTAVTLGFVSNQDEFLYRAYKRNFKKEAQILVRLGSFPGIVTVRNFFEQNNTSYIVMEYLDGRTLRQYVKDKGGKLNYREILKLIHPMIDSLIHLHSNGVYHRDISPDNMMVLKNGTMKLFDFGGARVEDMNVLHNEGVNLDEETRSSSIGVLKKGYSPVEQYSRGGKQGPWTDEYALAATIYFCITGINPVEAVQRVEHELVRPSVYAANLPTYVENVILKGMGLRREDRYPDLNAFEEALYTPETEGRTDKEEDRETEKLTKDGKKNSNQKEDESRPIPPPPPPYILLCIVAIFLVIGIVAAIFLFRSKSEENLEKDLETTDAENIRTAYTVIEDASEKGDTQDFASSVLAGDLNTDEIMYSVKETYGSYIYRAIVALKQKKDKWQSGAQNIKGVYLEEDTAIADGFAVITYLQESDGIDIAFVKTRNEIQEITSVEGKITTPEEMGTPTPKAIATFTPIPEPTQTFTPTSVPTVTFTPIPESTATVTPRPEPTEAATPSPEPRQTPTPEPTYTLTPEPTAYTGAAYDDYLVTSSDTSEELAGKVVKFNDIDWYIISDNSTAVNAGTVTLLAKDPILAMAFDLSNSNTYNDSAIKAYLDRMTSEGGSFADVAEAIIGVDLMDAGVTGAKLWLLSTDEVGSSGYNLSTDVKRCAIADEAFANQWWLRSLGDDAYTVALVDGDDGSVYDDGDLMEWWLGVRPALKLNLSSVIFSSESKIFTLTSTPEPTRVPTLGLREKRKLNLPVREDSSSKKLYLKAVGGDVEAQCELGNNYYNGQGVPQDYGEAVEWYTKAAEQGNAKAQYNLGNCYEKGTGVDKDLEKAVEWYTKAAEQGYAKAQFNLGDCYRYSYGVDRDNEKALEWYTKAAEQGNLGAQIYLGDIYFLGEGFYEGVQQDYEKAFEWYNKAAEQGDADSQYIVGEWYYYGNGVPQSYEKAVEWYTKAAEQGVIRAQADLGVCYANGLGTSQNLEKAVEWYTKAAEQGYAFAQSKLGNCYYNGQGVPQDYEKAVEWYTKAAEEWIAGAQYMLGNCYYNGQGVPQDYGEAVEWFAKAAEQDLAEAQNILGVCYEEGRGVPQSYETAEEWYSKAAEQGHDGAQFNLDWLNDTLYRGHR